MKNYLRLLPLALLLLVTACGSPPSFHNPYATGHYSDDIVQCAVYARDNSDIKLRGDADSWWEGSRNFYLRGNEPKPGAVLVLKRTSHMRSGHVAVVKNIISDREINVAHSNWGSSSSQRHIIYDSMRVQDVSPLNDWTKVEFWNNDKGVFGFPYAAYGFIYP